MKKILFYLSNPVKVFQTIIMIGMMTMAASIYIKNKHKRNEKCFGRQDKKKIIYYNILQR